MLIGSQWNAELNISSFLNKWLDMLTLFGYQGGVKLISLYGIASLLSFIPALYAVYMSVHAVRTYKQTGPALLFAELTVLLMLITEAAAFTLLKANYNSSYWIPAFICIIVLMTIRTGISFSTARASRIFCVWIVLSCITSAAVLKRNTESPLRGRTGLQEAAEWLAQSGCTEGYAQFWDADAAVEMTDGKLDIYAVESMEETDRLSWGQSLDHFDRTLIAAMLCACNAANPDSPALTGVSAGGERNGDDPVGLETYGNGNEQEDGDNSASGKHKATPEPKKTAAPTQAPAPAHTPAPTPEPTPAPTPEPTPAPTPEQTPEDTQEPSSEETQEPETSPEVTIEPEEQTDPENGEDVVPETEDDDSSDSGEEDLGGGAQDDVPEDDRDDGSDPSAETVPEPTPVTETEQIPATEPDPVPESEPDPVPEPVTVPDPEPAPDPVPEPVQEPVPEENQNAEENGQEG